MIGMQKKAVKAQFGPRASEYAKGCFAGDETLDLILSFIEPTRDDEVLDVATGAGFTAAAFAPLVREVVACDLTEEMLEQAEALFKERELKNVLTDEADVEELPYADDVFDAVACRIAAHHFPRARKALMEMVRVLKPGGRIAVADTMAAPGRQVDQFLNELELLRDPSHVRNYTETEWESLFTDCRLGGIQATKGVFTVDFDEWVERAGVPDKARKSLRKSLLGAPAEIKEALDVKEDGDKLSFNNFWIVIGGVKPEK
ncbi:MAG: class I SAM-dependent methyltransferase [Candidatus Aquicultorales bacterium]